MSVDEVAKQRCKKFSASLKKKISVSLNSSPTQVLFSISSQTQGYKFTQNVKNHDRYSETVNVLRVDAGDRMTSALLTLMLDFHVFRTNISQVFSGS